ncbi:MAG TPA: Uma2 family endonuclease [Phaeodactylibacter sp.]|nr:Uma2 family endonuclease [Phaeodactylibacter sp.]
MTLQSQRYKITVDEYYKMAEVGILKPADRVELIEGEILTMSPINSPHMGMVNILTRFFFKEVGDNATISVQHPILLNEISEPEPDIVLAKFRLDGYSKNKITPSDIFLLVEVSDSTIAYDRETKIPLYAKANIQEYWIVNIQKKQIEQYTQPKGNKYLSKKIIKKSGTISCTTIDFSLNAGDIFPSN